MRLCANEDCAHGDDGGRASLDGRRPEARYCTPACRAEAFGDRHGIVPVAQQKRANGPQRHKPSGLQVSYRKAVMACAGALWEGGDLDRCIALAEDVMKTALPDKQRARLEAGS